jgi:hypothetical protein
MQLLGGPGEAPLAVLEGLDKLLGDLTVVRHDGSSAVVDRPS